MTMTEKRLLDDSFVWDAAAQEEAAEAQRKVAGLAPPPIPEELRQEAPPLQEQTRSNVIHILNAEIKALTSHIHARRSSLVSEQLDMEKAIRIEVMKYPMGTEEQRLANARPKVIQDHREREDALFDIENERIFLRDLLKRFESEQDSDPQGFFDRVRTEAAMALRQRFDQMEKNSDATVELEVAMSRNRLRRIEEWMQRLGLEMK